MAARMHELISPDLDTFITRMPKVELHLHLEGSMTPQSLLEIAARNQVELPANTIEGLEALFRYQNFSEFLGVFIAMAKALRYGRDFAQVAYDLGGHLHAQNVRYAEVMISPAQYVRRGIDLNEVIQGAAEGFAQAQRDYGVRTQLALDFGRQFGVELATQVVEIAIANRRYGLAAWSIGGDELGNPPEPFAPVFARAREGGLRTMAHAGEVVGAQSVWGAVDVLKAERIGHGIRCVEDPQLVQYLCDRQVVLDVCPTSNLLTGAAPSLAAHPLRQLYDAGVRISINTDDPIFFHTTMNDEYRLAAHAFGFSAHELAMVMLDSARATFLPKDEKALLVAEFERELANLGAW